MTKWGFIGCGNLSQAIISGALKKKLFKPSSILISNRTLSKSKTFAKKTKVRIAENNKVLIKNSDVIFIGTKPIEVVAVLEELESSDIKNKIIISLAAGVTSHTLKKYCKKARSIIRVMANTPVTIQEGFFGILSVKSNASDKRKVFNFFSNLGHPIFVKNDFEINAITAGSASGVGFVFNFMEEYEKWFRQKGLSSHHSRHAAVVTFLGAAGLALTQSSVPLSELRARVTSKKGTTEAGLKAIKAHGVGTGLKSGLDAAFRRSNALAKSLRQNHK